MPTRIRQLESAFLRLGPIGLTIFLQTAWVVGFYLRGDVGSLARKDWQAFYDAGCRLLRGDLAAIYPGATLIPQPWLYPPYCIWFTAPLGLLSPGWAYIACVSTQIVAVLAAIALLRRALPARAGEYLGPTLVVLASMPFNTAVIIGQASGLLVLALAAALRAWQRGGRFVAGLLLALVLCKPNLGVVFPVVCVLAREWRVLAGIVSGFALLLLGSLPLGLARWHEYLVSAWAYSSLMQNGLPVKKQLSLYGFWKSLPYLDDWRNPAGTLLWLVSITPLGLLTAAAWTRRWSPAGGPLARLFGLTVLFMVSANIHLYHYDGLLLLFPGIAWYMRRDEYRPGARRLIGACLLLAFVVSYVGLFALDGYVALAAPFIAIWLVAEAYDLLASRHPVPRWAS